MAPGRPRRPYASEQPQSNQGGSSSAANRKRVRGRAKNKYLTKHIKRGGGRPRIEILPGKARPIGDWGQEWINELGLIAKDDMPPFAHKWKDVDDDARTLLHEKVLDKFDMDMSQPHVVSAVNGYLRDRFKDYRASLHMHYVNLPNNVNKREHPYSSISQDAWESWCDLWETEKFKNVSEKNKYSRSCLTTGHRGGSKSFIRALADMADPESQQEPSQIELYKNTHYNEKKGWISLQAEENYERMCELQSEPPQEGSTPLTEQQIFDRILGVRRGYNRGLGHGQVAPSSKAGGGYVNAEVDQLRRRAADAESQLEALRNSTQERMNAQQQEMDAQKARIDEQQRALDFLMSKFQNAP